MQGLVFAEELENCQVTQEILHQPIGDETGSQVMTAKKVYRTCEKTVTAQGRCVLWDYNPSEMSIPTVDGVAQEEFVHNGSFGSVMATFEAINRSRAMFNGVKGYCEYGTTTNFDWLNDPAMWASLMLSAAGSGAFGESAAAFTEPLTSGFGGCLVGGALDLTSAALALNASEPDCDPVDEFCDESAEEEDQLNDPALTDSITVEDFNQLKAENPNFEASVVVIDDGAETGYVVFRYKTTGELADLDNVDQEQIATAQQEAKEKQFQMRAAVATIQVAACMGSQQVGASDGANSSASGAVDAGGLAANAAVSFLPFPYNTIAALALKFFQSFDDIDSCQDEDDANAQGARHEMAYRGVRFNTCHPLLIGDVVEEWPWGDTMRQANTYCCFDSPLSKILMVQMKSQVGKGWDHCTGITLNEFAHMSFAQCSSAQMSADPDGASFRGTEGVDYDMKNSFQYKNQCMDLTSLKEYIESQVPVEFGDTHVNEMLERISPEWSE